jgi:hypothetical protein
VSYRDWQEIAAFAQSMARCTLCNEADA